MTINIRKYTSEDYPLWNQFVARSKNATFLFHRDFMEYHSDRFEDYSLMFFDKNEYLIAILPANRVGAEVFSHQGLTYGDFVFDDNISTIQIENLFISFKEFLNQQGILKIFIKKRPPFYDFITQYFYDFYLFTKNIHLYKKDLNLALRLDQNSKISKSKLKHYKKRINIGFQIKEEQDFTFFWEQLLTPKLQSKYDSLPVHSLQEIHYLKSKFPKNIKLFVLYLNNEALAGITIFESKNVVKSQYSATNALGESHRAFDYLMIYLIQWYQSKDFTFFDMGTVMIGDDGDYNKGLLKQKEEFGCKIYTQDFFSWEI
jgi:hypothetical protein